MTEIEQLIEQVERVQIQKGWVESIGLEPVTLSWQEIKRQYNLYFPRATFVEGHHNI